MPEYAVSSATTEPLIRFDNVGMRYGIGPEVLRDVSFALPPGSFHFLTGQSGAGKTTLLKLMYLALRPTRGLISMFGREMSQVKRRELPAMRRRIGVVFQDFRLLDHMSAIDNVALPLRVAKAPEVEIRQHVPELLRWVGLGDRLEARPPILSGGEQQLVAIARAVINRPRLLLADEPTGNVDEAMAKRLLHLFVELNKLGTTIVVATHNRNLVEEFARPELVLTQGELSIRPAAVPRQPAAAAAMPNPARRG